VPAKLGLVLDELEKLSLTCTQRNPVQGERMLHVLRRENKPAAIRLADEQVPGRQVGNLAEIGLRQLAFGPDDISVFARIAGPLGSNLQQGWIFRLGPQYSSRWPRGWRFGRT